MIIRYCSDLHIDFPKNYKYFKKNPIEPGDILILAGDVIEFNEIREGWYTWIFDYFSKNFKHVIWIAGNHEYYNGEVGVFQTKSIITSKYNNIHLIYDDCFEYENINFICSTLWADIPEHHQFVIKNKMNDYVAIKYGDEVLKPHHTTYFHKQHLDFIFSNIKDDKINIVVTHHSPTFMQTNPLYKADITQYAYHTELHDKIYDSNIKYWIHGHTHYNHGGIEINNCKILCNQLGYVGDNHLKISYDAFKNIEL